MPAQMKDMDDAGAIIAIGGSRMRLVWLLEEHEDSRTFCIEALAGAGMEVAPFTSASALLARASPFVPMPALVIIDAWSARGSEAAIATCILPLPMVVLTTSFVAVARWTAHGATRFLPKPFDIAQLLKDAEPSTRATPVPAFPEPPRAPTDRSPG